MNIHQRFPRKFRRQVALLVDALLTNDPSIVDDEDERYDVDVVLSNVYNEHIIESFRQWMLFAGYPDINDIETWKINAFQIEITRIFDLINEVQQEEDNAARDWMEELQAINPLIKVKLNGN